MHFFSDSLAAVLLCFLRLKWSGPVAVIPALLVAIWQPACLWRSLVRGHAPPHANRTRGASDKPVSWQPPSTNVAVCSPPLWLPEALVSQLTARSPASGAHCPSATRKGKRERSFCWRYVRLLVLYIGHARQNQLSLQQVPTRLISLPTDRGGVPFYLITLSPLWRGLNDQASGGKRNRSRPG